MKNEIALYVHIPFCIHECGYCAFAKVEDNDFYKADRIHFIQKLLEELQFRVNNFDRDVLFKTLYIGGGTPSILTVNEIQMLIKGIKSICGDNFKEITVDCNPEHMDALEKIDAFNDLGVNRLSMGVQTLSDKGLTVLERQVNKDKLEKVTELLPNKFLGQLSYDLILAWPGQTVKDFERDDIPFLRTKQYDHLSLYLLNYEPGTRLLRDVEKGRVTPCHEEDAADIWEACLECTESVGLEQYEISSFCKNKAYGYHNIHTWKNLEYLGVGPGAVSRIGNKRWTNTKVIKKYMEQTSIGEAVVQDTELITTEVAWKDAFIFGMRYKEGVNLKELNKLYGIDFASILKTSIDQGVKSNHLVIDGEQIKFTQEGWSYFDSYISTWMLNIEEGVE